MHIQLIIVYMHVFFFQVRFNSNISFLAVHVIYCVSLCIIAKINQKISSLESELAALKSRIAAYALAEVERSQGTVYNE